MNEFYVTKYYSGEKIKNEDLGGGGIEKRERKRGENCTKKRVKRS